jgi:hypothetical protein
VIVRCRCGAELLLQRVLLVAEKATAFREFMATHRLCGGAEACR